MSESKALPSSPETEADVIGACIAEGATYWRVVEQMGGAATLDLFHSFEHALVAKAVQKVCASDRPLTLSAVVDELSKDPVSERLVPSVNGYVSQLQVTSSIHGLDQFRGSLNALIEQRSTRSVLVGMEALQKEILDGELSLDAASAKLRDISVDGGGAVEVPLLGEIIGRLKQESALGVEWRAPSGLRVVDEVLNGGYEPRRLYLIGARPKVGKSMILFNGALESLASGAAVLFVSLELSEKELWTKMLSSYSSIEQRTIQDIFDGKTHFDSLDPDQQEELADCEEQLSRSKLHTLFVRDIRDGVNSVVSAIMSLRLKYGEGHPIVVFVDYIQLFVKNGMHKREEIEDASRKLKLAALEHSVSVVAAAQVNRDSAKEGEGGMPRAHMLRDSGSLEQDADVVMMLNRPVLQDETASAELMNILVELNRTGPSGKWLDVRFLPEFQQLADFDLEDDELDEDGDERRQSKRTSRTEAAEERTFEEDEADEDEAPRSRRSSRDRDSDSGRSSRDGDERRARRSSRRRSEEDEDALV